MLSIDEINKLQAENQKMKASLIQIEGLCKTTSANVKRFGFERDYNYKAIVQHNNKILKAVREGLK
jgi:hypothetical protein